MPWISLHAACCFYGYLLAHVSNASFLPRAGTWYYFLQLLGFLAVFSNLGVIVFTGNHKFFNLNSYRPKLVAFVIIEHAVFFLKVMGAYAIPDESERTRIQLERAVCPRLFPACPFVFPVCVLDCSCSCAAVIV